MHRENVVCIHRFGVICGSRHPLGVLRHVPQGKGDYYKVHVIILTPWDYLLSQAAHLVGILPSLSNSPAQLWVSIKNNWGLFCKAPDPYSLKSAKSGKNKGRWRDTHRPEETRETWWAHAIWCPGVDPRTRREHQRESCGTRRTRCSLARSVGPALTSSLWHVCWSYVRCSHRGTGWRVSSCGFQPLVHAPAIFCWSVKYLHILMAYWQEKNQFTSMWLKLFHRPAGNFWRTRHVRGPVVEKPLVDGTPWAILVSFL